MKLADLRALPLGAPLLAGRDAEPVVLATITPAGPGRRTATARVLTVLGDERDVQPRLLAAHSPAGHPDVVMVRPDLAAYPHTVTIEHITATVWPKLGIGRGAIGQLAVIERGAGTFTKVCALHADLWGGHIEQAALSYADDYKALYVPEGRWGVWDDHQRRWFTHGHDTRTAAGDTMAYWRHEYAADHEDPDVLSVREIRPAVPTAGGA